MELKVNDPKLIEAIFNGDAPDIYFAPDVDTIIAEKNALIAELQAENAQLKKETEFMHSNCKWDAGDGCARLLGEKLAIIDENEKLKQKLESAQASMYADVVDASMENRRLRRALWRAIALFCARSCEYFNGIMSHCLMGQDDLYKRCEEKKYKYLHTMYKCRAKAEEYK